ncbi:MAG TPA: hypothetical protein VFT06_10395 [Flavisolibacter sp.]|nr:hypothetical protein [Flavisolibacter sp.]
METLLIITGTVAFYAFVFWIGKTLHRCFDEANKAKYEAMRQTQEGRRILAMITDGRDLVEQITDAVSYQDFCQAQAMVSLFADTYRDVPDFESYYRDLLNLLERSRRIVRINDRATPFDNLRYSAE